MFVSNAVAIVGIGALMPDAFDAPTFWNNIKKGLYSITDVPEDRWRTDFYFDSDPTQVDKTYTKIGAFVRGFKFDPLKLGIPIPPRVLAAMDQAQQWAIYCAWHALADYGYPKRALDPERVAVILGNSMGGEENVHTSIRIFIPEYLDTLSNVPEFRTLPPDVQAALVRGLQAGIRAKIPTITEDTIPGELANVIAGRVANVFNLTGPNYTTDAACASSLAAIQTAVEGLLSHRYDAVLSGGVDRSMGPESFIKFCKIGALSPDGSRPYADGANGFVMGEGGALFLLKRLVDAERDGDKIYAVIRGTGGSSDGKGKGITAPNPAGQQRAIVSAWKNAGLSPDTAGLVEGHGTSTRVGDVAEMGSLNSVFAPFNLPAGKIPLGSVKSNIGHLKSAAGAAGILKTTFALYEKVIPPSLNFHKPNPNIDFAHSPFYVNTGLHAWEVNPGEVRRAGVSSFGFGGTNFHIVLEEHIPGMLTSEKTIYQGFSQSLPPTPVIPPVSTVQTTPSGRGMASGFVNQLPPETSHALSPSPDLAEIKSYILAAVSEKTGYPPEMLDMELDLEADLGVDTVKQAELFAAIRTHYGIPRREDLRLSDYNTLNKVVGFITQSLNQAGSGAGGDGSPSVVTPQPAQLSSQPGSAVKPYHGLFFLGKDSLEALKQAVVQALEDARQGHVPASECPSPAQVAQPERLVISYKDAPELAKLLERALASLENTSPAVWGALNAQGIYRGRGAAGKVAFLFPGQGAQYINMLRDLSETEPLVVATFREADEVMTPILGKPLTAYIFADGDEAALKSAEGELRNTTITQPAMLTTNVALYRLMAKFGFYPDMVIGHSLGEYAALVAGGVLTFAEALEVVSARGREMTKVSWADNGCMAAVSAPLAEVERILQTVPGYVVVANYNSPLQSVIGGETAAVDAALAAFKAAGLEATKIPVSHAFHTKIVAPASAPLRTVIARMNVQAPKLTIVANVTGEVYPQSREEILDILAAQVDSPVQFVKGMQTLYAEGARVFVETGPKRVASTLAADNLKTCSDVLILATNHPRKGGMISFNEALCGLYAAGVIPSFTPSPIPTGMPLTMSEPIEPASRRGMAPGSLDGPTPEKSHALSLPPSPTPSANLPEIKSYILAAVSEKTGYPPEMLDMELDLEADLGVDTVKQAELFAAIRTHYSIPRREDLRLSDYNTLNKVVQFIVDSLNRLPAPTAPISTAPASESAEPTTRRGMASGSLDQPTPEISHALPPSPSTTRTPPIPTHARLTGSVVISGAGLGLPGKSGSVFDDRNITNLLNGKMCIEPFPLETRQRMVDKRVTRLVKSDAGAVMQLIDDIEATVKLGGQRGAFNLNAEFGVQADRVDTYDISTQLAIGAGIEALRDAGIPLVMTYKQTSKGTLLPDRWKLPESLADETGVIFGSAFPGLDRMAEEAEKYNAYQVLVKQVEELRSLLAQLPSAQDVINRRIGELEAQLAAMDYHFDRRFVFRVLAMGHSQFAEYIGARGPNTHVNAACATTTHAVGVAEDWIRSGRCRRVVIISGDDVTGGSLSSWIGTSLMASGAATTEGDLRLAALPFDKRRNGMIMGMGAAALVVEAEDAVRERGMSGIAEILSTQIANSAFHGTRLDVGHVGDVMERLVTTAEQRFGIQRAEIAAHTVFVSHETYTPARGGSASAEIHALRRTFGDQANQVIIANTKGYTGHSMGVGIEDVVAVKALEYSTVPPVAHILDGFEPDPDLGDLNLSRGGQQPVQYALRLGAGFGSQLAMTLLRKITPGVRTAGKRVDQEVYNRWLADTAGYERAELEVMQRTLRIKHTGAPVKPPRKSIWKFGEVPVLFSTDMPSEPVVSTPGINTASQTVAPATRMDMASQPIDSATRRGMASAPVEQLAPEISHALPPSTILPPSPVTPIPSTALPEITSYILAAVSEKTGYPPEMLDMELDLEADLGIDTVKQAELFAAIRTHYGIPRREDLRLSDYNTLHKVVQFIVDSLNRLAVPVEPASAPRMDVVLTASEPIAPEPRRGMAPESLVQPVPSTSHALPPSPTPPTPSTTLPDITAYILAAVSEKTGYPPEMLDMELDLEADLGIDTVKQAELFAAIRTHYGIPRREDLRLSDYNTLHKVVQFIVDSLNRLAAPAELVPTEVVSVTPEPAALASHMDAMSEPVATAPCVDATSEPVNPGPRRGMASESTDQLTPETSRALPLSPSTDLIPSSADQPVPVESLPEPSIRRRVPVPALRPRLDLCVPTPVKLSAETRLLIIADGSKTADSLARRLRSRQVRVVTLTPQDVTPGQIASLLEIDKIHGVYYLPALDVEPLLSSMIQDDSSSENWQAALETRLFTLYHLMRSLPGQPFLICATRMGGLHGYSSPTPECTAPLGGAVSGFAKALAMERPQALVKVVDFPLDTPASSIASRLVEETLSDTGVVEVGYQNEMRYGITLVEKPWSPSTDFSLNPGSVYLVSGGTGGITAPVILDLAQASGGGTFYLLGRTPMPDPSDPDLPRLKTDRLALKQDLMQRMAQDNPKVTPVQVDARIAALERGAAALEMIDAVQRAGGKATYIPCDITDPGSALAAVQAAVQTSGHIDVFLHAAGVERSRKLESKPEEEFRQTVAVKANGFYNLFKALAANACLPQAVLFFTSVAGRFGNSGQTDYAAANDLLCKLASAMPSQYPAIKTLALDWGAWAEVGMASRGHIPALMKYAGIDMLHPAEAAPLVRTALLSALSDSEVVLAGSLGALLTPRHPDGGLDLAQANVALRAGKPIHKMLSDITGFDLYQGVTLETELDPQTEPFLKDHALNGIPLLPGVMGVEGFSAAAQHIASVLASRKGSFKVIRLENIEFRAAIKFYKNEPRRITWKALAVLEAGELVIQVTLESTQARYNRGAEKLEHFSGKVFLQAQPHAAGRPTFAEAVATLQPPHWNGSETVSAEDIYRLYFHGPAFQVLAGVQRSGDGVIGRLQVDLPPLTSTGQLLLTNPLLLELCFQTAGIWEVGQTGVLALPQSIEKLVFYPPQATPAPLFAEVTPIQDEDGNRSFDAHVKDENGVIYLEVKNYRTSPLSYSAEKELVEPLKVLRG